MDEKIEERINSVGAKIDIIESINNALLSSLLGADCLTQKGCTMLCVFVGRKDKGFKNKTGCFN